MSKRTVFPEWQRLIFKSSKAGIFRDLSYKLTEWKFYCWEPQPQQAGWPLSMLAQSAGAVRFYTRSRPAFSYSGKLLYDELADRFAPHHIHAAYDGMKIDL